MNRKANKTSKKQTVKFVAYNPTTRRYEEVHPEDEVIGSKIITLYYSGNLDKWVTIPESE